MTTLIYQKKSNYNKNTDTNEDYSENKKEYTPAAHSNRCAN